MTDIQQLLTAYDQGYQARFPGEKPRIVPGKDAKLAKDLLAIKSLETLSSYFPRFFASTDPLIVNAGYTFAIFAFRINAMAIKTALPRHEPTDAEQVHARAIFEAQRAADEAAKAIPAPTPPRQYITKEQHQQVLAQLQDTKRKLFGKVL